MNVQATLVIILLLVLVGLGIRSEWRAMNPPAQPEPAATASDQPGFSVTPVSDGQYVMRASDKIFYCVNNRCTGIQLITAQSRAQNQAPAPTGEETAAGPEEG